MHHALHLEEVLLNIFGHCHPADPSATIEWRHASADLAALARTCRTFKEPALDVLWLELVDLSPLAFCLPGGHRTSGSCYLFTTPRNNAEWDTLRGYTRRVRRIVGFSSPSGYLDQRCISATFDPPLPDPLFPNLRFLVWQGGTATLPVIHFAAPLLTSLDIRSAPGEDASLYTDLLDTLVPRCPNIRDVRVQVASDTDFGRTVSRHLRSWPKLHVVDLLDVTLPVDVVLHLSRIPTLTWLSFMLSSHSSDPIPALDSTFVFSQLVYLEIVSASLDAVVNLITHLRLPAAQALIIPFPTRPSKATVKTYLTTVNRTCSSDALLDLRLLNLRSFAVHIPSAIDHAMPHDYRLTFDDIRPCMVFSNLRGIHINLEWSVDLTDGNLLALVSAWPHIEHLLINDQWGWRTTHGITLRGLVQVLQTCRELQDLCVAIDTRSAVEFSLHDWATEFTLPSVFRQMNVADSVIHPEDVPALGTSFSALGFSSSHLVAWCGSEMEDIPGADGFRSLWVRLFH